ncbi:MAG: DUF1836 domain-containing protein [Clostridia bacterium]|nr:DUF1836 domain-containing protein [Clostridia bacterium]
MDIRQYQPVTWDQIPDLGLYMDQVITFIGRVYAPLYGPEVKGFLSAAMINNYVKARLVPRPAGKKYSREQIALLTMIVALKQVCSMEDIRQLLTLRDGQTVEGLYDTFCARFSQVVRALRPEDDDPDAALDFAIRAAGYRVGCTAALDRAAAP